jgi:hypothetical protein
MPRTPDAEHGCLATLRFMAQHGDPLLRVHDPQWDVPVRSADVVLRCDQERQHAGSHVADLHVMDHAGQPWCLRVEWWPGDRQKDYGPVTHGMVTASSERLDEGEDFERSGW